MTEQQEKSKPVEENLRQNWADDADDDDDEANEVEEIG